MQMNVDKQIFELTDRVKRLMTVMEAADELSDSGVTPASLALANDAWRKASRELSEVTSALAAMLPESLPAMAAIAGAAADTGSPVLIASLRDALLRMAMRQAEAAEHHCARIEDEPPIGILPDGRLNRAN